MKATTFHCVEIVVVWYLTNKSSPFWIESVFDVRTTHSLGIIRLHRIPLLLPPCYGFYFICNCVCLPVSRFNMYLFLHLSLQIAWSVAIYFWYITLSNTIKRIQKAYYFAWLVIYEVVLHIYLITIVTITAIYLELKV